MRIEDDSSKLISILLFLIIIGYFYIILKYDPPSSAPELIIGTRGYTPRYSDQDGKTGFDIAVSEEFIERWTALGEFSYDMQQLELDERIKKLKTGKVHMLVAGYSERRRDKHCENGSDILCIPYVTDRNAYLAKTDFCDLPPKELVGKIRLVLVKGSSVHDNYLKANRGDPHILIQCEVHSKPIKVEGIKIEVVDSREDALKSVKDFDWLGLIGVYITDEEIIEGLAKDCPQFKVIYPADNVTDKESNMIMVLKNFEFKLENDTIINAKTIRATLWKMKEDGTMKEYYKFYFQHPGEPDFGKDPQFPIEHEKWDPNELNDVFAPKLPSSVGSPNKCPVD